MSTVNTVWHPTNACRKLVNVPGAGLSAAQHSCSHQSVCSANLTESRKMTEPAIQTIQQKLDNVLGRLKTTNDPHIRRRLLTEMRVLIVELDQIILRGE